MGGSTIGMLFRLVVSLGVVLGLMAVVANVLRRTGVGGGPSRRRGQPVEVVARHALGRRSSLALVRAGGKGLILGVTDNSITVLAETAPDDLLPPPAPGPGPAAASVDTSARAARTPFAPPNAWTALLEQARERTVRR